jgi:hypothetical protein
MSIPPSIPPPAPSMPPPAPPDRVEARRDSAGTAETAGDREGGGVCGGAGYGRRPCHGPLTWDTGRHRRNVKEGCRRAAAANTVKYITTRMRCAHSCCACGEYAARSMARAWTRTGGRGQGGRRAWTSADRRCMDEAAPTGGALRACSEGHEASGAWRACSVRVAHAACGASMREGRAVPCCRRRRFQPRLPQPNLLQLLRFVLHACRE